MSTTRSRLLPLGFFEGSEIQFCLQDLEVAFLKSVTDSTRKCLVFELGLAAKLRNGGGNGDDDAWLAWTKSDLISKQRAGLHGNWRHALPRLPKGSKKWNSLINHPLVSPMK